MHHVLSIFLIAAMVIYALAAPTPPQTHAKRHFSIPVRGRSGHRKPSEAMARAYRKFGWEIVVSTGSSDIAATSSASSAASSASSSSSDSGTSSSSSSTGEGSVEATPEQNESEYLEPVSIGGQTLNLDFDTGSADLWVFSTDLDSSEIGQHTAFNPSKSTTWSNYTGASWQIGYGDGSGASGRVGYDTVTIGGLSVEKQAVELADAVSVSFVADTANDGLLGLGFTSINTIRPVQKPTWFQNIMPSLAQPVFTADLQDGPTGSTYEFGTIDASKYVGDLHVTPIDSSNGFWQFPASTFTIGSRQTPCTTCSPAIADTGTSLVLVDADIAAAYYSAVSGSTFNVYQGGYVYANLPTPQEAEASIGEEVGDVAVEQWKASRRAIIHTIEVSPRYSAHAEKVVKGFRHGMYYQNVDFHVGSVSEWTTSTLSARGDAPFLSHAFLDLPGTEEHLAAVTAALRTDGTLIVFCPSITQIMACLATVKEDGVPLELDRVIELGVNGGTGGREWDVRAVKPRAAVKAASARIEPDPETANGGEAESREDSGIEVSSDDMPTQQDNAKGDDSGWKMVCRPKVGELIVGGGFLGVFKKLRHTTET